METTMDVTARFRGYLPVVVDVETAGFNAHTDALLEVAAVPVLPGPDGFRPGDVLEAAVHPFDGANLEPAALRFTGIDPDDPARHALPEAEALRAIFSPIRQTVKEQGCSRAIMVAHNAAFDQGFINAAVERCGIKRSPFHPFSSLDTATLAGLAYGHTVLREAMHRAGLEWDSSQAHSAAYDAERTAWLFCDIVNAWDQHIGVPAPPENEGDQACD